MAHTDVELPPEPSLLGQVLGDRYRLVRELGEGGMGRVFLAEHVLLGKQMAVKVLRDEFNRNPDLVKRFQLEAVAASQIGQENIVDVTDFGRTSEGAFYFVMEYLPGESLGKAIDTRGPMVMARALPVMVGIARALEAAHARGIVHRDLKPDNVVLVPRDGGRELVKVLDFGISKVGEGPAGTKLTQAGMVVGTPHYMSPEQGAGDPVDARSDIYAFGVLAFEICTGKLPFDGPNGMAILMKHQSALPMPPRAVRPDLDIPQRLEALILQCLEKDRLARPQSMLMVEQSLIAVMTELRLSGPALAIPLGVGASTVPLATPRQGALDPIAGRVTSPSPTAIPNVTDPSAGASPFDPRPAPAVVRQEIPTEPPRTSRSGSTPEPSGPTTRRSPSSPHGQGALHGTSTAAPAPAPAPRRSPTALDEDELAAVRPAGPNRVVVAVVALLLLLLGGYLLTRGGTPEAVKPVNSKDPAALADPKGAAPLPAEPPKPTEPPKPAAPKPVAVRVLSEPAGALLSVDGVLRGPAPQSVEVVPGTPLMLAATLDGRQPAELRLDGSRAEVTLTLAPLPEQVKAAPVKDEPRVEGTPKPEGGKRKRPATTGSAGGQTTPVEPDEPYRKVDDLKADPYGP